MTTCIFACNSHCLHDDHLCCILLSTLLLLAAFYCWFVIITFFSRSLALSHTHIHCCCCCRALASLANASWHYIGEQISVKSSTTMLIPKHDKHFVGIIMTALSTNDYSAKGYIEPVSSRRAHWHICRECVFRKISTGREQNVKCLCGYVCVHFVRY